MTSPRLKALERGFSASPATAKSESLSMKDVVNAIEEQAMERIEAAEALQHKAEAEAAELRKEISRQQKEMAQMHKDMQAHMDGMQKASTAEYSSMRACYEKEMKEEKQESESKIGTLKSKIESLKEELASECQARIKAESQLEAIKGHNARLEQLVQNFKVPAPVIQNNAAPARSATAKVDKRDGNGRIVSFTITPN